MEYLETQYKKYNDKLREYEERLKELLSTLNESEKHIELLKFQMDEQVEILSDIRIRANNMENHIKSLIDRKKNIEKEEQIIKLDIDSENMKLEELNESIQHAKSEITRLAKKKDGILKEKDSAERDIAELRKQQNEMKSQLQIKTSRYRMLEDMEENLEGYSRSVKNLLLACERSSELGKGIHGVLARLISVDPEYESAIEMSLGSAVQDVVTSTEEDAKRAIEFLKRNKLGRVTFLPISSVKPRTLNTSFVERLKSMKGYIGQASGLVKYDAEISGIISNLLDRVIVFDNIDNAINAARKLSYSIRIVTLDGDVISTSGSITGGSREVTGTGILGRRAEISRLKQEVIDIKAEETRVSERIAKIAESIEKMNVSLNETENELKNNELVKIRDESHVAKINETIEKDRIKLEMLADEKSQVITQIGETEKELAQCGVEMDKVQQSINEAAKTIEEHRNKQKEDMTLRDELYADITDYKVSVNSISENMASVKEMIERVFIQKDELVENIKKKDAQKAHSEEEIEKLNQKNDALDEQIKKYIEEKTGKTFEMDRISEERKVLEEELSRIDDDISAVNENIILLGEEQGRIEVRKTRIAADMDAAKNRLWDDYELTYNNAVEFKKNIGSITSAQKEIDSLKAALTS